VFVLRSPDVDVARQFDVARAAAGEVGGPLVTAGVPRHRLMVPLMINNAPDAQRFQSLHLDSNRLRHATVNLTH